MSQDKSPHTDSSAKATVASAKAGETPMAEAGKDDGSGRDAGQGNRKQSVLTQPVDALRQPAGKDNAKRNSGAEASNPPKNNRTTSENTPGSTSTMNSPKPTNDSKARGVWASIFLGLVLIAAALAAGLWWQQQRFEAVAKEVATRLQKSDQQLSQVTERASQALTMVTAQREVVDQLRRELSLTNNELRVLQQAWEAANDGLDQTLLLNDLKRLIGMANQELTLFGNVNSAVSILSAVESMLKAQPAAPLKTLQQAVTTDLARLRAVPQVDLASLSASLDSLIQLTGSAPLLSPQAQVAKLDADRTAGITPSQGQSDPSRQPPEQQPHPQPAAPAASDKPWWEAVTGTVTTSVTEWTSEASTVLLQEFADLMSIRKADDPQALLLSEEQAIQLRANVRAMLLSAQLALMTRQADIWRSELSEVQSLLNTRYDKQALDTKAAMRLASELIKAPVAADVPQINDTLGALASAERALSIPAQTTSHSRADGTESAPSDTDSSDVGQATVNSEDTGSDTVGAVQGQAPAAQSSQQGN